MMSEEAAQRHGLKPAWIRGVGFCTDAYYLGHRDLTAIESAHSAAARAYKMAGISNPRDEIKMAEVHAPFSFQELMMIEALGFCDKGAAGQSVGRRAVSQSNLRRWLDSARRGSKSSDRPSRRG
jgi:acetyl-CoA C-acetyltransferase